MTDITDEPTPELAPELGPELSADQDPAADPGLAAERDKLARTLRDTRLQLAMTQARLAALEESATMVLGRTLVRAARRPWSRGVQLPLDLIRLWRERGGPGGPGAATLALASAQLGDLAGGGERFLSALTAPGLGAPGAASAGIVVTGVLSAQACATLAPDAAVQPLLPHDADVILESAGADLVIIEAAAMLAGSAWAYAGDPAATDRGRRLGRLIATARALGKPVIFVRNIPPHLAPGLDWVAASCDAVSDDGFGVQLARFNPVGRPAYRPCDPVYAGTRDPREAPAVRALLDAVSGSVRITGEVAWRRRPGLYRDHGVFVSVSADQAREQLACGARVIGPLGSGLDSDAVRAELDKARTASPLSLTEIRGELRDVFICHATPARLTAIARAAGVPAGLVGGRQIAVLEAVTSAEHARKLAAALLAQRLRPAEVVAAIGAVNATEAASVRDALGTLTDHGIRVVTTGEAAAAADPGWARPLARLASAPWLALWDQARAAALADSYLLDLACARECSQADAVGFGTGDYEFTSWLDQPPCLVRRDLLVPEGPPMGDWGSHGLRLFTIAR